MSQPDLRSTIKVREAGVQDAASITCLVQELAASEDEQSPIDRAYVEYYLAQPNCHALVTEMEGRVIGLLSYLMKPDLYHAGDTCYITELVVAEQARGRGAGSALIEALFSRLEGTGCAEVSVTTMTDNEGAIRFYKRHGLVDEAVFLEKHFARLPRLRG
jgi:ribosomal protein S18 acetylase RimI-like enzyme